MVNSHQAKAASRWQRAGLVQQSNSLTEGEVPARATWVLVCAAFVSSCVAFEAEYSLVACLLLTALLITRGGVSVTAIRLMFPIVLAAAISVSMTVVWAGSGDELSTVRALYYFLRVPAYFLMGFALAERVGSDNAILKGVILVGVIAATIYLWRYISDPAAIHGGRLYVRSAIGTGNVATWLVPACAVALWRKFDSRSRLLLVIAGLVSLGAIAASASRSGLLTVIVSIVVMAIGHKGRRGLPVAVVALLVAVALLTTPIGTWAFGPDLVTTLVPHLVEELTAPPGGGLAAINNQWRGYEAAQVFNFVAQHGLVAVMFGTGLSTTVPLGLSIELGGAEFDRIGVFHSAFSFLFLRTGLIGMVAYFYFAWRVISAVTRGPPGASGLNYVGLTSLVVLFISTPTTGGIFNQGAFASVNLLLAGAACQRAATVRPRRM